MILETHCIDAFSLYWHGRLQNPFIGQRIITLSLVCGQLPIGSSSNDIQLLLVASSRKGTDMDKEGCGLQRQRAQEVGALLRLRENLTEHMLGHASTEMTKPWLPIKCREKQNPLSLQALGSLEQAVQAAPACLRQSPALREGEIQARLNVYAHEASIFTVIQWSVTRGQCRFKVIRICW